MSYENQKLVVLQIAHEKQSIKSNVAAIRLLGCFDNVNDMQEYIKEFQQTTSLSCIGLELNQLLPLLRDVNDYHTIDSIIDERRRELLEYATEKFETAQNKLLAAKEKQSQPEKNIEGTDETETETET